ncbi:MAG: methyltransferase domain-containing protein [Phycisphaeraceae bacterium]|nr:methyltransferase domain-containing protein [Phycisphaeraceae bacterium]
MNDPNTPIDFSWSKPEVVAHFSTSPPNTSLIKFADVELRKRQGSRLLDIGCGAGSNAVPLAKMGWNVLGLDLSQPMLDALAQRVRIENLTPRLRVEHALMTRLSAADQSIDLIVAHGIWNLARSGTEFRQAIAEAARVSRSNAGLFVYTFSRTTLPISAKPVSGESFVFRQFSDSPQCFLTEAQLIEELETVGFAPEPNLPIKEFSLSTMPEDHKPVIYEGVFRRR